MKRGKQIHIHLNFSNRWLYTFIFLGIIFLIGASVYAYNTGSPTTSGHTWNEIAGIPAGFADGVDNAGSFTETPNGLYGWCYTYNGWCNYKGSTGYRAYPPMYCTSSYSGTCYCASGYEKVMVGSYSSAVFYACYKK
jgi:hypothetical protein